MVCCCTEPLLAIAPVRGGMAGGGPGGGPLIRPWDRSCGIYGKIISRTQLYELLDIVLVHRQQNKTIIFLQKSNGFNIHLLC